MSLTDELYITVRAGKGGDGVVRWRREKFKPKGGPCGGDGGDGGDFIIEGIRDITALRRVSQKESYEAEDGQEGGSNSRHGANGKDFILSLPIGSLITNVATGEQVEVLQEGTKILLCKGGKGGLGNEHFKSSTNQRPMHATKGQEGEGGRYHIELKLIADVGLVGLPNAGKTSLLNALTNAGARVAEYPFTTLGPNLGAYFKYIIADIPGLIEGASEGKGLGHAFLRHITRTNVIIHCISLEQDTVIEDYETIRKELSAYPEIIEKREYVVLTKNDTVEESYVKKVTNELKSKKDAHVLSTVSVLDDDSIKRLGDSISQILQEQKT